MKGIGVTSHDQKKSRGLRVFHCTSCGHHLRFGGTVCGGCFRPTPVYNRRVTWVLVILLIMLVVMAFLLGSASPK